MWSRSVFLHEYNLRARYIFDSILNPSVGGVLNEQTGVLRNTLSFYSSPE